LNNLFEPIGLPLKLLTKPLGEKGWNLEASVSEIAEQLVLGKPKAELLRRVFPVYLQIFLKQAEQDTEGRITAEFMASLGGVFGLIGKYLEQQCGAVLESLSRSAQC
jgi:hypothetical protein